MLWTCWWFHCCWFPSIPEMTGCFAAFYVESHDGNHWLGLRSISKCCAKTETIGWISPCYLAKRKANPHSWIIYTISVMQMVIAPFLADCLTASSSCICFIVSLSASWWGSLWRHLAKVFENRVEREIMCTEVITNAGGVFAGSGGVEVSCCQFW